MSSIDLLQEAQNPNSVRQESVAPKSSMSFLDQFSGKLGKESELSTLKREREEARALASRLHVDLDRVALELDNYKSRAFGAERASQAAKNEERAAKLALLKERQQTEALRAELLRLQQFAADRDALAVDMRSSLDETKTGLARAHQEIEQLKRDRENEPVNDVDLLIHYKRLRSVFESLQSTLTCALCFEPFRKGDVMTFACGHTYCLDCVKHWAVRSAMNHFQATQGANMSPECPECRGDGSRHSRVKVFLLEEAVRVMNRLEQADMEAIPGDEERESPMDEEAAQILMPRARHRYAA